MKVKEIVGNSLYDEYKLMSMTFIHLLEKENVTIIERFKSNMSRAAVLAILDQIPKKGDGVAMNDSPFAAIHWEDLETFRTIMQRILDRHI